MIASLTATSIFGQKMPCPQPKFLDFFGLDGAKKIEFEEKDINMLMADDSSNLYLLLPTIVSQLKYQDKRCKNRPNKRYFQKLFTLYCKIRVKKTESWSKLGIAAAIDSIYADFEQLARTDSLLHSMIMTLDDGPFYGVKPPSTLEKPELITIESFDIGKLQLEKTATTTFQEPPSWSIAFTDENNVEQWRYQLQGLNKRMLTDCRFEGTPVRRTSLAYIIYLVAEGERLTLYIGLDGRFMWYFHSW